MPLPASIRVKLSTEAAGAIALTPVVVQEMPVAELIEHMLGVTGKDAARVAELLQRGTLVSGASRFRWNGLAADPESVRAALAAFPDPDPSRAFDAARCTRAVLHSGRHTIDIPRAAGERRGFLRRTSFWDALMAVAATGAAYTGYSYRDRADRYSRDLTVEEAARVRAAASLVRYTTLRDQLRALAGVSMELWVER